MNGPAAVRCPGCAGCAAVAATPEPSPALAGQLTRLAWLLFAGPLAALLLLATLLEGDAPGFTAAALVTLLGVWGLFLRRLRPQIERRLRSYESELPRLLLVRESGADVASRMENNRRQS